MSHQFILKHEIDNDGDNVVVLYKAPVSDETYIASWRREYKGEVIPQIGFYPKNQRDHNDNVIVSHMDGVMRDIFMSIYDQGRADKLVEIQDLLGIKHR